MADFKIGDVVRLKSGGPKMTVDSLKGKDTVQCRWFEDKQVRSAEFSSESLKKVEGDGGPKIGRI